MIPDYKNKSLELIVRVIDEITYTEEFKPVVECPDNYHISSFGRLKKLSCKSIDKTKPNVWYPEKIIVGKITKKGYVRLHLKYNNKLHSRYSHRLVALSFLPKIEGKPDVNHKKAIKTHNHYSLLEWCTATENNNHAISMGLFRTKKCKISDSDRNYIKSNINSTNRKELAEKFNVSEDYIYDVGTNRDGRGEILSSKKMGIYKSRSPFYKKVINTQTGEIINTKILSEILNIRQKYVSRMLNGERKPNTSIWKYA